MRSRAFLESDMTEWGLGWFSGISFKAHPLAMGGLCLELQNLLLLGDLLGRRLFGRRGLSGGRGLFLFLLRCAGDRAGLAGVGPGLQGVVHRRAVARLHVVRD